MNAGRATRDFKYRIVMLGYICFSKIILSAVWKIHFCRVRMKAGIHLGDLALTQARENGCLSQCKRKRDGERWRNKRNTLISVGIKNSEHDF